jgi:MFS family permease
MRLSSRLRRVAASPTLLILSRPDLRRLVTADFVSLLGSGMVLAAMPFAVFAVGGSATEVGLVLAVQGAGLVGALPFAGVVGDRVDRRSMLVVADLVRVASQATIAALLLSGVATVAMIMVSQLILGVATGFFQPTSRAIVPDVAGEPLVQSTAALKGMGWGLAGSLGPALGAVAIAVVGPGLAMAADAATFAISATLILGIGRFGPGGGETENRGGLLGDLRYGLTQFARRPWLRAVTIQFLFVNALVVCPFYVLGPILAGESLGGSEAWALLLIGMAIGQIIGSALGGSLRSEHPLVTATLAFTLYAVPLVLLSLLLPLPVLVFGALIGGVGEMVFVVLWETTFQTHTPKRERSRITSIEEIAGLGPVPLGFALAGAVNAVIGARPGLLFAATLLLVSSLVVLALPSIRTLTRAGSSLGSAWDGPEPVAEASTQRQAALTSGGSTA